MAAEPEDKKICPLCRRSNEKGVAVCTFCKYVFDKSAVPAQDDSGDKAGTVDESKTCPYCLGSGTTVGGKCQFCWGSGKLTAQGPRITCAYCTGTGKTVGGTCYMCEGQGYVTKIIAKKVCRYCGGAGTTIGGPCEHCDGRGVIILEDESEGGEEEEEGDEDEEEESEDEKDDEITEVEPPDDVEGK